LEAARKIYSLRDEYDQSLSGRVIFPYKRPSKKAVVKRGKVISTTDVSFTREDFDEYLLDDIPNLPDNYNRRGFGEEFTETELKLIKNENQRFRKRPLDFVKKELGIPSGWLQNQPGGSTDRPPLGYKYKPYKQLPLWSKQKEILNALVEHKRVAVKSGHGVGKTYIAAIATLYLTYVWRALGVTTAPTWRQVRYLLWQEIATAYNRANQYQMRTGKPGLGGRLLQTSLELGDKWYVVGFSTDKKDYNIPGFHEETVFAIIDEACGVDPIVYDLLETILNSENAFVLYIGNPTDPNTEFKRCFDPNSGFHQISIPCSDSPNVKHGRTIYPKLVKHDWPERMKKKWGEDSALYKSRVLAEFPDASEDSLISLPKIESALVRSLEKNRVVAIGGDIARFGGDRIILSRRHASGRFRIVYNIDKARTTESTGRIIQMIKSYSEVAQEDGSKIVQGAPIVNIDDIGVGGGVTDQLVEKGYEVNGINVAQSAKKMFLDKEMRVEFKNLRSYYYWKLKIAFDEGRVDIDDEELAEELMYIKTKFTSDGKILIIEKEKIKETLGRSPDKADSMMLAFAEDEYIMRAVVGAY